MTTASAGESSSSSELVIPETPENFWPPLLDSERDGQRDQPGSSSVFGIEQIPRELAPTMRGANGEEISINDYLASGVVRQELLRELDTGPMLARLARGQRPLETEIVRQLTGADPDSESTGSFLYDSIEDFSAKMEAFARDDTDENYEAAEAAVENLRQIGVETSILVSARVLEATGHEGAAREVIANNLAASFMWVDGQMRAHGVAASFLDRRLGDIAEIRYGGPAAIVAASGINVIAPELLEKIPVDELLTVRGGAGALAVATALGYGYRYAKKSVQSWFSGQVEEAKKQVLEQSKLESEDNKEYREYLGARADAERVKHPFRRKALMQEILSIGKKVDLKGDILATMGGSFVHSSDEIDFDAVRGVLEGKKDADVDTVALRAAVGGSYVETSEFEGVVEQALESSEKFFRGEYGVTAEKHKETGRRRIYKAVGRAAGMLPGVYGKSAKAAVEAARELDDEVF